MILGLLLGRFVPQVQTVLEAAEVGGISLAIGLGLLVMMVPPLAKVRYGRTLSVAQDWRVMGVSLVLNWLVGPSLMFALAWMFLPDHPELRSGLIIVGLARCIAMVLVWTDMACADRELTAVLVTLNAIFQVVMFGLLGALYLQWLPQWLGLGEGVIAEFSLQTIVVSVLVFLGVPLLFGVLMRSVGEATRGQQWYEETFLPAIGPWSLIGLLYTVVVLFALQGDRFVSQPAAIVNVAIPLLGYFIVMFMVSLIVSKLMGFNGSSGFRVH